MFAAQEATGNGQDEAFWDRLKFLEARHQTLQARHEQLQRRVDDQSGVMPSEDLRETWKHYCEVIAELEHTAEEFTTLRPHCL